MAIRGEELKKFGQKKRGKAALDGLVPHQWPKE